MKFKILVLLLFVVSGLVDGLRLSVPLRTRGLLGKKLNEESLVVCAEGETVRRTMCTKEGKLKAARLRKTILLGSLPKSKGKLLPSVLGITTPLVVSFASWCFILRNLPKSSAVNAFSAVNLLILAVVPFE